MIHKLNKNAQQDPNTIIHGFLRGLNLLTCHFD